MQFSAIRTYCATRFRDTGLVIVTDAQWKDYVNSAYGAVNARLPYAPWNEASATVTIGIGVRSGALPTDCNKVISVWNSTDQYPMVPLEGRTAAFTSYPQQNETGPPQQYRLLGNSLFIYPLPTVSTAFTVEHLVLPADMVNDADLPAFPQAYHDMLVSLAVGLAYRDDGNLQMAQAYEAEAESGIHALIQDSMQPRQDRFYEIVDADY